MSKSSPPYTPGESTPGPWVADECGAHVHAADKTICHASIEIDEDTPANMRLIAAAPDLLTALESAQHYMRNVGLNMDRDFPEIQASIDKARKP